MYVQQQSSMPNYSRQPTLTQWTQVMQLSLRYNNNNHSQRQIQRFKDKSFGIIKNFSGYQIGKKTVLRWDMGKKERTTDSPLHTWCDGVRISTGLSDESSQMWHVGPSTFGFFIRDRKKKKNRRKFEMIKKRPCRIRLSAQVPTCPPDLKWQEAVC